MNSFQLFSLVVHMFPLWWGLHSLTFWCPQYPCYFQHFYKKKHFSGWGRGSKIKKSHFLFSSRFIQFSNIIIINMELEGGGIFDKNENVFSHFYVISNIFRIQQNLGVPGCQKLEHIISCFLCLLCYFQHFKTSSLVPCTFLQFCWPMYTDLGRLGDTFVVAGNRAI